MRRHLPLVAALGLAGVFWLGNPVVFTAEDCYFYAVVARNLALRGVQAFWGVEPTNGVHPLWLYLLAGYDWFVAQFSVSVLYRPAFGVPLVLGLTSAGALNWSVVAWRTRLPVSLLVFPQLLFLAAFGLLYSEAHAAFFAHSLLARGISSEEDDGRPRPLLVGLAAAAVLLARLDNVFYVAAVVAWYGARRPLPTSARMALACGLPVGLYLASNVLFFGGIVPVSGYLKSTFPVPQFSGLAASPGGLVLMYAGYSIPLGWAPIGAGILAAMLRPRLTGAQTLLYPLLAGAIGHALYTALFTTGFTFWYWYYLLPIVLGSWALASLLSTAVGDRLDRLGQWMAVVALGAALLTVRLAPPTEDRLIGLTSLRIVREEGIDRATLLVSEWPGTLAFFTHNHVIAADMLTSNRRLVDRMVSAPDAAAVLLDEARRLGTPVDYVLFNGGLFLQPYADRQSVELRDPRMLETLARRAIGRLTLGPALSAREGVLLWRVPPTALPSSRR
ncbi:MAG TPA: hypothetical protein VM032_09070 [Vicinamibacterales bacterium]|nr:hypothetical protein [Vicinamibacterales bacterium]